MVELDKIQQESLLALARKTIAGKLNIDTGVNTGSFSDNIFREKCGAFVTVHKSGELRGCIGYIEGVKSIPETVTEMAFSAAFRDPRFAPLSKEEYPLIDLEISVLSPIEKVNDINEIVVGRDGLIISKGLKRGLLLPQVATEYGWDKKTFLEQTCYKAGLPKDSWKNSATLIEKFSAQVFSEKDIE